MQVFQRTRLWAANVDHGSRAVRSISTAGMLILIMSMAGCGFHLRSSSELPAEMQRTYLNIPGGNNDLVRELIRSLSTARTTVVSDPTQATATLNILSAQKLQRVLSVSNIGRPLEKEVAYQVQFSLTSPKGTLIGPQNLVVKRNFAYDEANALGDSEQAAVLYAAMQHEMAQLILFRIEALTRHAAGTGSH